MMTAAIVLESWIDQLDEDTTLGGPDLAIEVSEEVHSYQSVDALVPEREHSEGESGVATPSTVSSATRIQ